MQLPWLRFKKVENIPFCLASPEIIGVKVCNKQTDRQTDRETDRLADRQIL